MANGRYPLGVTRPNHHRSSPPSQDAATRNHDRSGWIVTDGRCRATLSPIRPRPYRTGQDRGRRRGLGGEGDAHSRPRHGAAAQPQPGRRGALPDDPRWRRASAGGWYPGSAGTGPGAGSGRVPAEPVEPGRGAEVLAPDGPIPVVAPVVGGAPAAQVRLGRCIVVPCVIAGTQVQAGGCRVVGCRAIRPAGGYQPAAHALPASILP